MLNFKSPAQLILVSLVIAVIPAVAEEMFFRGLLLGDLLKGSINPYVAIGISGLLFAVAHFEFENTLAIWVLGSFLGYLYYVSGSLWLPIGVHFINNFLQVFFKYLYNNGYLKEDVTENSVPVYITIISVAIFAGCIFVFQRWKNKHDTISDWEEVNEQIEQI